MGQLSDSEKMLFDIRDKLIGKNKISFKNDMEGAKTFIGQLSNEDKTIIFISDVMANINDLDELKKYAKDIINFLKPYANDNSETIIVDHSGTNI